MRWMVGAVVVLVLGVPGIVNTARADHAPNCFGRHPTIVGTPGDDRGQGGVGADLTGTSGSDVIVGLGGNDRILGLGGNDFICGNGGSDQIDGGDGADKIAGQGSQDTLFGGCACSSNPADGGDLILGGSGNDAIIGEDGADTLRAGGGADGILGDQPFGRQWNDVMSGGPGPDGIEDPEGDNADADKLLGGADDDSLMARDFDGLDTVDGGTHDVKDRCEVDTEEGTGFQDSVKNCEEIFT